MLGGAAELAMSQWASLFAENGLGVSKAIIGVKQTHLRRLVFSGTCFDGRADQHFDESAANCAYDDGNEQRGKFIGHDLRQKRHTDETFLRRLFLRTFYFRIFVNA